MYRSIPALLLMFASTMAWAQVNQIGFDLSGGSTFSIGQAVDLTLQGTNWTTDNLEAGGVTLNFNSSVLQLTSISLVSLANGVGFDYDPGLSPSDPNFPGDGNDQINNVTGTATQEFFALVDTPPGDSPLPFSIATFAFTVVGAGTSALSLSADPIGFSDAAGNTPAVSFAADSVSVPGVVSPVPEPPTLLLLGAIAISSLFIRRRLAARLSVARGQ